MNPKLTSALSYFTIIGWILALVIQKSNPYNLNNVHLKNSLGLHAISFILGIITPIVGFALLGALMGLIGLAMLVLYVIGIIWALSGHDRPLPLVGEWFQKNIPDL